MKNLRHEWVLFLAVAAALAVSGCGKPHFSSSALEDFGGPPGASRAGTTVGSGVTGGGDAGGGGGGTGAGGTTGGNPIVHELAMSIDANASLLLSGFLGSCPDVRIETIGPDLISGVLKLRITHFGTFCSPGLFTSPVLNPTVRFALARNAAGETAGLQNSLGRFSSSDRIDFTVSGTGVDVTAPGSSAEAVEYTIDFQPALLRLESVGLPTRSGTPAQQIDSDIGGSTTRDAVYCTVEAEAARTCRP